MILLSGEAEKKFDAALEAISLCYTALDIIKDHKIRSLICDVLDAGLDAYKYELHTGALFPYLSRQHLAARTDTEFELDKSLCFPPSDGK